MCIINVVVIITQPMNVTVCLTQSTTASFTCVVDRGSSQITSAEWHILAGGAYIGISGRDHHMDNPTRNGNVITDTLTITNVSGSDNGALYRCEPDGGDISIPVSLTVLGKIII